MTVRAFIKHIASMLSDNAEFEAREIYLHCSGVKSVSKLVLLLDDEVRAEVAEKCENAARMRQNNEPLYYILGECEFYGLDFFVGHGVLIPRADTETLVDCALERMQALRSPRVLDLCSGSGCVAVAVAKARPDAKVTAVELYDEAYAYLCRNIERNQTANVTPVQADALAFCGEYDVVVSNPPYIAENERSSLDESVLREPDTALFADEDGMLFYRKISENFAAVGKNMSLMFEVGYKSDSKTAKIMADRKYKNIRIVNDLCGIGRVVCGDIIADAE